MDIKDTANYSAQITCGMFFIIAISVALGIYFIHFNARIDDLRTGSRTNNPDCNPVMSMHTGTPQHNNELDSLLDEIKIQCPTLRVPYKPLKLLNDLNKFKPALATEFLL